MRHSIFISAAALLVIAALSGCNEDQTAQNATGNSSGGGSSNNNNNAASMTLPSGSAIDVTLNTTISSKDANVGDSWSGTVRNAAFIDGRTLVPAGSAVSGTVTSVKAAHKGDRAMLDLGMHSFTVDGRDYRVHGSMESVEAGSTRARNLGAIAGSAAAGALVGQAVGGSTKSTVIGAVVGGGVATGVVAKSDGYQVVLKPGVALTFTTNESVAVRL